MCCKFVFTVIHRRMSSSNDFSASSGEESDGAQTSPPSTSSSSSSMASSSSDMMSSSSSTEQSTAGAPAMTRNEINQGTPAEEVASNDENVPSQIRQQQNEDRATHLDDDVDEVVPDNDEPTTIFDERGRRRSGRQHALAEAHSHHRETIDITDQREMETRAPRGRRHVRIIRSPRGRPRKSRRQSSEEPILLSSGNDSPILIDANRQSVRNRHSASLPSPSTLDASFRDPFRHKRVRFNETEQEQEADDTASDTPSLTMEDVQDNIDQLWEAVEESRLPRKKQPPRPIRSVLDELLQRQSAPSFYNMHRRLTAKHSLPTTPRGQGGRMEMPGWMGAANDARGVSSGAQGTTPTDNQVDASHGISMGGKHEEDRGQIKGKWIVPKTIDPMSKDTKDLDWWFYQMEMHLVHVCQITRPEECVRCLWGHCSSVFRRTIYETAQSDNIDMEKLYSDVDAFRLYVATKFTKPNAMEELRRDLQDLELKKLSHDDAWAIVQEKVYCFNQKAMRSQEEVPFTDAKKAKFFISALELRVRDFLRNKVDWDRPHEVDALQVYQWADQCVDEINREERGSKARDSEDTVMVAAQNQAQKKKRPWFRNKKIQNRQPGNRDRQLLPAENAKPAAQQTVQKSAQRASQQTTAAAAIAMPALTSSSTMAVQPAAMTPKTTSTSPTSTASSQATQTSSPLLCHNCKQPGHFKRQCPNPLQQRPRPQCSFCQRLGHDVERCWKKFPHLRQQFLAQKYPETASTTSTAPPQQRAAGALAITAPVSHWIHSADPRYAFQAGFLAPCDGHSRKGEVEAGLFPANPQPGCISELRLVVGWPPRHQLRMSLCTGPACSVPAFATPTRCLCTRSNLHRYPTPPACHSAFDGSRFLI